MNAEQLVGKLTKDETVELTKECLTQLSLDEVIEILAGQYSSDDRDEIAIGMDAAQDRDLED